MRVRLRFPGGQTTLELPGDASIEALTTAAAERAGLDPRAVELLVGFPPKPVSTLGDVQDGDTVVIRASGIKSAVTPPVVRESEPAGPCIVRRVMPSDNSCLFRAVGYVAQRDEGAHAQLRETVARTVASNPDEFSEAFLGRPNAEYVSWIRDVNHWGGAIELMVLSRHLRKEIWAFDIQTGRIDRYGQDQGYAEGIMLLYDGIHYDALAECPAPDAPKDFDVTVFPVGAGIDRAAASASALVAGLRSQGRFTDVARFTLRCGRCGEGLVGQKEAVAHAAKTGHTQFEEYR